MYLVELEEDKYTNRGCRYNCWYEDKLILKSYDPEYDICRYLQNLELKDGFIYFFTRGLNNIRSSILMSKGAKLRTEERNNQRLRIGKYKPHPKSTLKPSLEGVNIDETYLDDA